MSPDVQGDDLGLGEEGNSKERKENVGDGNNNNDDNNNNNDDDGNGNDEEYFSRFTGGTRFSTLLVCCLFGDPISFGPILFQIDCRLDDCQ